MRRSHYDVLAAGRVRHVVLWDIHWRVIECRALEPGADGRAALAEAVAGLCADGWRLEGEAEHGFVFVSRRSERALLMITERDPRSTKAQSFSPF